MNTFTIIAVALIAAVPPTIAAIAAWQSGRTAAAKAAVAATLAAEAAALALNVKDKAEVIHVLVNSQLTAVKADLVIANGRIAELLRIIASHKEEESC